MCPPCLHSAVFATGHPQARPRPRRRSSIPGKVVLSAPDLEVTVHPLDDPTQTVRVQPPLAPGELAVVSGLAGAGDAVRRVWPSQPGRRSPWLPCQEGCCLVADERADVDPVAWLRFLIREVLDPHAAAARGRAAAVGLPGGHRLSGEVLLVAHGAPRLLVVAGRRVRVVALGDDLAPTDPGRERRRALGEVVDLGRRTSQRTER